MRDSGIEWIGEIPADWEVSTIKREYSFQTGWTPDTTHEEYFTGENIWINISDMKSKVIYNSEKHISDGAVQLASMNISPKGSLLYAFKLSVGAVAFCGNDMYTNEAIATFLPGKNSLRFLYYTAPIFIIKNANENIYGAKLLNQKLIRNAKIIVPPLAVQERIADYLDRKCSQIDAIIARQREVIEKLKAYKLSVITEAVTKGLNPDVPMKDSGVEWIGEIPEHWENRKMISILSMRVVDGPHESPELYDKGIPYISATAIENGKINFDLMRGYISEEYCDLCDLRYKPQLHDILVIKLGASTGQVAIVETTDRFNIWVPLAAVRCNENADPYFVYYAFQSDYFLKQMEMSWTYGTQQTLGVKSIERLRIMLPTLEDQKGIVSFLKSKCDSIDTAIENKKNLITKLTDYQKSLIYEVVTGKKEV